MSDIESVTSACSRILRACRPRRVAAPGGGPDLSAHQASLLRDLDEHDPTMVTELADYLGVTPSTMSLTLKRLEARGYVERARDPQDRRVVNVRLTPRGVAARDAVALLDPVRVDRMLLMLEPALRREALRGLAALADAADRMLRRGDAYLAALTTGGEP